MLTDARRATRLDDDGELVPLAEQDRARWRHDDIAVGGGRGRGGAAARAAGEYQLEAAIAACHASAPTYEDTDWEEIASLYGLLLQVDPDPVTRLNHAVALAEAADPATGLAARSLDRRARRPPPPLGRGGRPAPPPRIAPTRPALAYDRALGCAPNDVERRFLERRRAALP